MFTCVYHVVNGGHQLESNEQNKMALSLEFQDLVLYSCSCTQFYPLGELFFCRHCKVPRCQDCVSSTVESFSCPHCFETAGSDIKAKRGRCTHCFQCLRCASALSTRSVIVPSEVLGEQSPQKREQSSTALQVAPSPSTPPKSALSASSVKSPGGTKMYYLSCSHCKWSTRDVGIADQRSVLDFRPKSGPHTGRIDELVAFYKEFALQDKAEHEKAKKNPTGRRYRPLGSLLDPSKLYAKIGSGGDSPASQRRGTSQLVWDPSLPEKMAAKAADCPQPAPAELYSTTLCLEDVSTLQQRLRDPINQPASVEQFLPKQLSLMGKKLHRCKGCDHILMKAEMNPGSIRFKIQQIAFHTFPRVCLVAPPSLKVDTQSEVLLSVSNPGNYAITISLEQCSEAFLQRIKGDVAETELPNGEFVLTQNDDLGDLLDDDSDADISDDPNIVHSRHPGKIVLKFGVLSRSVSDDVRMVFKLNFTFKSVVENYEVCNMSVHILVHLGKSVELFV